MEKILEKIGSKSCQILPFLAVGIVSTQTISAKDNHPKKVNVVYIMADDLGIGDVGCYGQRVIKTPNIDQIAQNGMRFTQHYSGSTVSAPSRCSVLTGKHTGHAFIRGNASHKGDDGRVYDWNLAKDEITLGEIFKQKGYKTACVGKWGLGAPNSEGSPLQQGFDYFFGFMGQLNAHFYFPDQLIENDKAVYLHKKKYSANLIIDKALEFIDKNADQPFFLYYTPTLPHAELALPKDEKNPYSNRFLERPYVGSHYCSQPQPKATFAGMVRKLDMSVGKIVKSLKEKGIYDNTIIIFTSDNGTHNEGGHDPYFFDSNGPFRGIKRDLYEGGIRTPYLIQWPGVIKPQSTSYHVAAFWDLMPTLCDIIGVKTPKESDGISFLPTLTGKGKQKKHDYLYFEFFECGGRQAVIKDRWKLIHLNVNNKAKEKWELYNLEKDPAEFANVAADYPKKVEQLKKIMTEAHSKNKIWKFKE